MLKSLVSATSLLRNSKRGLDFRLLCYSYKEYKPTIVERVTAINVLPGVIDIIMHALSLLSEHDFTTILLKDIKKVTLFKDKKVISDAHDKFKRISEICKKRGRDVPYGEALKAIVGKFASSAKFFEDIDSMTSDFQNLLLDPLDKIRTSIQNDFKNEDVKGLWVTVTKLVASTVALAHRRSNLVTTAPLAPSPGSPTVLNMAAMPKAGTGGTFPAPSHILTGTPRMKELYNKLYLLQTELAEKQKRVTAPKRASDFNPVSFTGAGVEKPDVYFLAHDICKATIGTNETCSGSPAVHGVNGVHPRTLCSYVTTYPTLFNSPESLERLLEFGKIFVTKWTTAFNAHQPPVTGGQSLTNGRGRRKSLKATNNNRNPNQRTSLENVFVPGPALSPVGDMPLCHHCVESHYGTNHRCESDYWKKEMTKVGLAHCTDTSLPMDKCPLNRLVAERARYLLDNCVECGILPPVTSTTSPSTAHGAAVQPSNVTDERKIVTSYITDIADVLFERITDPTSVKTLPPPV